MRKDPASEVYDVPQYSYFEFGNNFTGSYGKLSYKITPGEDFTVQIWHSRSVLTWQKWKRNRSSP